MFDFEIVVTYVVCKLHIFLVFYPIFAFQHKQHETPDVPF